MSMPHRFADARLKLADGNERVFREIPYHYDQDIAFVNSLLAGTFFTELDHRRRSGVRDIAGRTVDNFADLQKALSDWIKAADPGSADVIRGEKTTMGDILNIIETKIDFQQWLKRQENKFKSNHHDFLSSPGLGGKDAAKELVRFIHRCKRMERTGP
jgi:hypothetical protein